MLNNNGFAALLTDLLTTNELYSGKKNQMIMDKDRKEEHYGALSKFKITFYQ
ncbi:MAG TPA: hypothetical protein VER14_05065 [Phototrophicaceae bacterium]|nr:hypothetical protein [Phototrophicaceae bacterium]